MSLEQESEEALHVEIMPNPRDPSRKQRLDTQVERIVKNSDISTPSTSDQIFVSSASLADRGARSVVENLGRLAMPFDPPYRLRSEEVPREA